MFGLFRKKPPQEAQPEEEPKALPEPKPETEESADDKVLKDAVEAMLVEQASAEVEVPSESEPEPQAEPEPGPPMNVIGTDMRIGGSISTKSAVLVLGEIEGNVAGLSVTVEEDGVIRGDVAATDDVVVRGSVVGNMGVDGKLTITSTGRVEVGVKARAIAIEEGGELRGRCTMSSGASGLSAVSA